MKMEQINRSPGRPKTAASMFRIPGTRNYIKKHKRQGILEDKSVHIPQGQYYQCPDCWTYYSIDENHTCK